MALKRLWFGAIILAVLSACDASDATPASMPVRTTPRLASTPLPIDTGWQLIAPGIEYRELLVEYTGQSDRLRIARVDPARTLFRVLYDPAQPRHVGEWLRSANALLAVNGNYFDPQNRALGMVIQDGQVQGQPYQDFGGMFAINGNNARVRWNLSEPYVPGEPLISALQNFPMLVLPGGQPNLEIDDNQRNAPRTAVGQDRSGRIVFVVSPGLAFTLTDFGKWLADSDLDLDRALNLDGGTSSGLVLRSGDQYLGTDSWVAVPDVIVVDTK